MQHYAITEIFPAGSGGISSVLRQVDNPVITVADCASVYGSMIDQRIICTDTTGGRGTCSVRCFFKQSSSTSVFFKVYNFIYFIFMYLLMYSFRETPVAP